MLRRSKRYFKRSLFLSTSIVPLYYYTSTKNKLTRNYSLKDIAQDQQLLRMSDFDENNPSENRYGLKNREEHKEDIMNDNEYDVLIVGGGATGAGSVLSAANSGLRALLIDSHDYASGASSKSSKLIHGGNFFEGIFFFWVFWKNYIF